MDPPSNSNASTSASRLQLAQDLNNQAREDSAADAAYQEREVSFQSPIQQTQFTVPVPSSIGQIADASSNGVGPPIIDQAPRSSPVVAAAQQAHASKASKARQVGSLNVLENDSRILPVDSVAASIRLSVMINGVNQHDQSYIEQSRVAANASVAASQGDISDGLQAGSSNDQIQRLGQADRVGSENGGLQDRTSFSNTDSDDESTRYFELDAGVPVGHVIESLLLHPLSILRDIRQGGPQDIAFPITLGAVNTLAPPNPAEKDVISSARSHDNRNRLGKVGANGVVVLRSNGVLLETLRNCRDAPLIKTAFSYFYYRWTGMSIPQAISYYQIIQARITDELSNLWSEAAECLVISSAIMDGFNKHVLSHLQEEISGPFNHKQPVHFGLDGSSLLARAIKCPCCKLHNDSKKIAICAFDGPVPSCSNCSRGFAWICSDCCTCIKDDLRQSRQFDTRTFANSFTRMLCAAEQARSLCQAYYRQEQLNVGYLNGGQMARINYPKQVMLGIKLTFIKYGMAMLMSADEITDDQFISFTVSNLGQIVILATVSFERLNRPLPQRNDCLATFKAIFEWYYWQILMICKYNEKFLTIILGNASKSEAIEICWFLLRLRLVIVGANSIIENDSLQLNTHHEIGLSFRTLWELVVRIIHQWDHAVEPMLIGVAVETTRKGLWGDPAHALFLSDFKRAIQRTATHCSKMQTAASQKAFALILIDSIERERASRCNEVGSYGARAPCLQETPQWQQLMKLLLADIDSAFSTTVMGDRQLYSVMEMYSLAEMPDAADPLHQAKQERLVKHAFEGNTQVTGLNVRLRGQPAAPARAKGQFVLIEDDEQTDISNALRQLENTAATTDNEEDHKLLPARLDLINVQSLQKQNAELLQFVERSALPDSKQRPRPIQQKASQVLGKRTNIQRDGAQMVDEATRRAKDEAANADTKLRQQIEVVSNTEAPIGYESRDDDLDVRSALTPKYQNQPQRRATILIDAPIE